MSDPYLRPPRPELLALLDAVKDSPDDDTPRLVVADWLDEQNDELDAERAAFIRADVARAHDLRALTPGEAAEATALFPRWLGPVAGLGGGRFDRGLPLLTALAPRLLKAGAAALLATEAFAFVQFVHLEQAGGPRLEALAARPEFRLVPALSAHPFTAPGSRSAAAFFGSPNLAGLRQIAFRGVRPGAVGVQALAANPALARLRKLALRHNKIVDAGARALAASAHLVNLEALDLSDNAVGDAGAEALAASAAFPNLQSLDLRENPRLTAHGKQLLRDRFGDLVKLD